MRIRIAVALLAVVCSTAGADDVARRRVHALVAPVGNNFQVIYEEKSTGSSIPPFRRRTFQTEPNQLNRLVLRSLDKAREKSGRGTERLYLARNPPPAGDPRERIGGR